MLETNKIYLGNSLELITRLDNESVDFLFTDPPYGISKETHFDTLSDGKGGRWTMDFEKHGVKGDRDFDQTAWLDVVVPKLKQGSNIVIFNDWKNIGDIAKHLKSLGCEPKRCLIWTKTSCAPFNRDRMFVNSCEFAIWATKGKKWTFNRQKSNFERGIFEYNLNKPQSVYPTQKPVNLCKEIITILSNEGQLVLDPFTGSGSIPVTCQQLNRDFIGMELGEKGYNIALRRLQEER